MISQVIIDCSEVFLWFSFFDTILSLLLFNHSRQLERSGLINSYILLIIGPCPINRALNTGIFLLIECILWDLLIFICWFLKFFPWNKRLFLFTENFLLHFDNSLTMLIKSFSDFLDDFISYLILIRFDFFIELLVIFRWLSLDNMIGVSILKIEGRSFEIIPHI